jgi:hypothetical protein
MYKEDATPTQNLSTQIVVNEKYISVKHQRAAFSLHEKAMKT